MLGTKLLNVLNGLRPFHCSVHLETSAKNQNHPQLLSLLYIMLIIDFTVFQIHECWNTKGKVNRIELLQPIGEVSCDILESYKHIVSRFAFCEGRWLAKASRTQAFMSTSRPIAVRMNGCSRSAE